MYREILKRILIIDQEVKRENDKCHKCPLKKHKNLKFFEKLKDVTIKKLLNEVLFGKIISAILHIIMLTYKHANPTRNGLLHRKI